MNSFKLTPRLQKISDLAAENPERLTGPGQTGPVVADIGTDHGYIPIEMLAENKCSFAILGDINQGPLDNAEKNLIEVDIVPQFYSLRLGSGLSVLRAGEADAVIIAGMGGELIADILQADIEKARLVKRFVFQPRTHAELLRKWLINNKFIIVNETVAPEKFRFSTILVAQPVEFCTEEELEKADLSLDENHLLYPQLLAEDSDKELIKAYLKSEAEKNNVILKNLLNADGRNDVEYKRRSLEERIARIDELTERL